MNRRKIELTTLEEILADARGLLKTGYDRAGNWSLGQVCNHLSISIDITLGKLVAWLPVFVQRMIFGTFVRLLFLGRFGNLLGLRLPTTAPQKVSIDDEAGLERLAAGIDKLKQAEAGHLYRFHLWHSEHHLSFLVPRSGP